MKLVDGELKLENAETQESFVPADILLSIPVEVMSSANKIQAMFLEERDNYICICMDNICHTNLPGPYNRDFAVDYLACGTVKYKLVTTPLHGTRICDRILMLAYEDGYTLLQIYDN